MWLKQGKFAVDIFGFDLDDSCFSVLTNFSSDVDQLARELVFEKQAPFPAGSPPARRTRSPYPPLGNNLSSEAVFCPAAGYSSTKAPRTRRPRRMRLALQSTSCLRGRGCRPRFGVLMAIAKALIIRGVVLEEGGLGGPSC